MGGMALAALIDTVRTANGWSDRDVVRQAEARGENLSRTDVSNYRLRGMVQLVPEKMIALAAGLRIEPYRVALAVLEDRGIAIPLDARTPEQAIRFDETLTAETRENLLAILDRVRATNA